MKNEDLKKVLKPLIKQCIKEVIFEEGVLSGIISEVAMGLTTTTERLVEETQPSRPEPRDASKKSIVDETKKRLFESISKDAYNGVDIFENTEPLAKGGSPGNEASPSSPLSSYAPDDAGVDIGGIMSIAGNNWSKLI